MSEVPTVIKTYDYANENAEIIGQLCDCEDDTQRWRVPDGAGWRYESLNAYSLPPFRLPQLIANQAHTVLMADTEVEAEILAKHGFITSVTPETASPYFLKWFEGRKVVFVYGALVRDGLDIACAAMSRIAKSVRVINADCLIVDRAGILELCKVAPDYSAPGGMHAALMASRSEVTIDGQAWTYRAWCEAGNDPAELERVRMSQIENMLHHVSDYDREELLAIAYDANDHFPLDDPREEKLKIAPFKCLGYDDGSYFYLPHSTQQLVEIGVGSQTSSAQLLGIAPLEWWEMASPGAGKTAVDWLMAGNMCIRWNESRGVFDPATIRGRGAWFDAGRSVLHLGNRLLVDHATMALHEIQSRFIYERKPAIESLELAQPLPEGEAQALFEITKAMNWSNKIDPLLLAGFMVLAPICGALTWRPHIWITAQRGSGKSWIFENIIAPVIGESALHVQGNTTEAAIRQILGQDGRPVIFDEAEAETMKARLRIQEVIELARQASTDGHAEVAKGTAGGRAVRYRVRSMFCYASINVALAHASDKSRTSVLTLGQPQPGDAGREQFAKLSALVDATLTQAWCASLRSRTYNLIPTIRANAAVLAKAGAEIIGNQRAGDQIGALLAGAYSLKSDARISLEDARKWVASHKWDDDSSASTESDEHQLCTELLHAQLRVDSTHGTKIRSVSELFQFLSGDNLDDDMQVSDANRALHRTGIKLKMDEGVVFVSDSHPELRRLLEKSAWGAAWSKVLERVPGAERHAGIRFAGVTHRAISIPLDEMMGTAERDPL